MPVRKSQEQFIEEAKKVHNNKYDYSKVSYVNSLTKVKIGCPIHGYFLQKPKYHLKGNGCPICGRSLKHTNESFIAKAREVHGDKYDYSKVEYKCNKQKVIIICPKHGEFLQNAGSHFAGSGCPECYKESKPLTQEEFIERSKKLHNNKYDYSLVEYKNCATKVKIICPVHGVFEQQPSGHLQGWGCVKCGNENQMYSKEKFIELANKVHNNRYDYSKSVYKGSTKDILITCPKHGDFIQRAGAHLEGEGCPTCCQSRGENKIESYLKETGVKYTSQYKFKDCRNKLPLPFDFAIFNDDGSLRCLIEYQGKQHYQQIIWSGKECSPFEEQQKRDTIKRGYCFKKGIPLLIISYKQDLQEVFEEAGGLLWK